MHNEWGFFYNFFRLAIQATEIINAKAVAVQYIFASVGRDSIDPR